MNNRRWAALLVVLLGPLLALCGAARRDHRGAARAAPAVLAGARPHA